MTGTSIAQAIPIAISPVLTRLYTPEDFGVFALYMAVASIVSVLVTGRYELAIMLPQEDSDAMSIVVLSAGLSCVISGVLFLIVFLFNQKISHLLGTLAVSNWLYLVPATTLLTGIYQSLNYWSNRKAHYKRMAISRMLQNGGASLSQLGGGYVVSGATGLVGGQLVGQIISTTVLARLILKEDSLELKTVRASKIVELAARYANFPKYMILGQLANVASGQMPLLLLNIFFGPSIAGFYSLSQRALMAPTALVSGAIGEVFRSEAAISYKKFGNCREIFLKTLVKLMILSAAFVVPVLVFGPRLFSLVFGARWQSAGEIASALSIMVFFQNISSPLSQTVLLAEMQAVDLVWQISRLIVSVLSLYAGYALFGGYIAAIALFAVSFSILYVVHSWLQYRVASGVWGKS